MISEYKSTSDKNIIFQQKEMIMEIGDRSCKFNGALKEQKMWCSTSERRLRKLHVSYFIAMKIVNVSHVLSCFSDRFFEQIFQKTRILAIEGNKAFKSLGFLSIADGQIFQSSSSAY